MARVNIYLPDDVAEAARAEGLNVSAVSREAIEARLAVARNQVWLDSLAALHEQWRSEGYVPPSHDAVLRALDESRAETGDELPPGYG